MDDERSVEEQMWEMNEGLAFYHEMTLVAEEPVSWPDTDEDPNATGDWLAADYFRTGLV